MLFDLSCGRVSARGVRAVGRARHHHFPSASSLRISMGGNECESNRSRGILNLLWAGGTAAAGMSEQIKIIWWWEQPLPNNYHLCPHSNRSREILHLLWAAKLRTPTGALRRTYQVAYGMVGHLINKNRFPGAFKVAYWGSRGYLSVSVGQKGQNGMSNICRFANLQFLQISLRASELKWI